MTTVAWREGVFAADSRATYESEAGGARVRNCQKVYRKVIGVGRRKREVLIAVSGDVSPALIFVEWYGSGKPYPQILADIDSDFTCLVYSKRGLFEYDAYCQAEEVKEKFWAIGSGAKAALGAMHAGADAWRAVNIACKIDPYTAPPVTVHQLSSAGSLPSKSRPAS